MTCFTSTNVQKLTQKLRQYRANALWARRGRRLDVHVHVHGMHSLPDVLDLDYGRCDPTAFLQVRSHSCLTSSLTYAYVR